MFRKFTEKDLQKFIDKKCKQEAKFVDILQVDKNEIWIECRGSGGSTHKLLIQKGVKKETKLYQYLFEKYGFSSGLRYDKNMWRNAVDLAKKLSFRQIIVKHDDISSWVEVEPYFSTTGEYTSDIDEKYVNWLVAYKISKIMVTNDRAGLEKAIREDLKINQDMSLLPFPLEMIISVKNEIIKRDGELSWSRLPVFPLDCSGYNSPFDGYDNTLTRNVVKEWLKSFVPEIKILHARGMESALDEPLITIVYAPSISFEMEHNSIIGKTGKLNEYFVNWVNWYFSGELQDWFKDIRTKRRSVADVNSEIYKVLGHVITDEVIDEFLKIWVEDFIYIHSNDISTDEDIARVERYRKIFTI